MSPDPFASSTLSLILAWLCALPVMISLIGLSVGMLFEKTDDAIPRWFLVWLMLCVLVLSPFRYMLLQIIVATAYPVQSISAFISTFALSFYVPIVFGVLFMLGLILPFYLTLRIAFLDMKNPVVTRGRLVLGAVIAPVNMIGGYLLFFWLLTYAAMSLHWLHADDVIGATNGPASFVYNHGLKYVTPLPIGGYYEEVTVSDRDMLRNHVASFYLGSRAEAKYVKLSYPALYERLTTRPQ